MIYLFFLIPLLLISCNQDRVKDNSKNEIIEYFIPLSHRVEKDVNEVFEEYWYVPLETRDDALIEDFPAAGEPVPGSRVLFLPV